MAAGKKKKKASANPARGFATTSIPKVQPNASFSRPAEVQTAPDVARSNSGAGTDELEAPMIRQSEAARDLDKLTPEELEQSLEASELQMLVEELGPSVKKDANRYVSRLKTEDRLLRNHALPLNVYKWFSVECLDRGLDLIGFERMAFSSSPVTSTEIHFQSSFSETENLKGSWTLRNCLIEFGFSFEAVEQAMEHFLGRMAPDVAALDVAWHIDACLEWLIWSGTWTSTDVPQQTETQGVLENSNSPTALSKSLTLDPSAREILNDHHSIHNGANEPPEAQNTLLSGQANESSSESGVESDLEPEDLGSIYLDTKARLYSLEPSAIQREPVKRKQKKQQTKHTLPTKSRKAASLQRKLKAIEADILFDKDSADTLWPARKFELDQTRNVKGGENEGNDNPSSLGIEDPQEKPTAGNFDEDATIAEEEGLSLNGLFEDIPDATGKGDNDSTNTQQSVNRPNIRDFGKWSGAHPSKVLEDACRSRDRQARLTYKELESTSFAHRSAVIIRWASDQKAHIGFCPSSCKVVQRQQETYIFMVDIATPERSQSVDFVSVVGLVFCFGSTEEKPHLRLPAVWRVLWAELEEARNAEIAERDAKVVQNLRDMLRDQQKRREASNQSGVDSSRARVESKTTGFDSKTQRATKQQSDTVAIQSAWRSISASPRYQHMLSSRKQLPIWSFKDAILNSITNEQIIIVCGETGCGKSTQVPSFILEQQMSLGHDCKVYCTEPRRISAISLAQRVAEELGQSVDSNGSSVGYSIRLDSRISHATRLVYATVGVVLRMLETSQSLSGITHLIVDEVHERGIDSDFLLIILKRLMASQPQLKIILMSATVDARRFSDYFNGAQIFNVPGRTFPVDTRFLEDAIQLTGYELDGAASEEVSEDEDEAGDESKKHGESISRLEGYSSKTKKTLSFVNQYRIDYGLITSLLEHIATDRSYEEYSKAILIFMPGMAEIRRIQDSLSKHPRFSEGWEILALHSSIASEEQARAFLVPPAGMRKIVISTNIAETGVTIPDVTCVIDTGKHKEMRFDERRQVSRLIETFISRVNAAQRRGRAGRVQKGLCFHLFTRQHHDMKVASEQTPEMLRLSLQELALRVKVCGLGDIEETLSEALSPPTKRNIDKAIDALVEARALTQKKDLTPLGRQLAKLPLDLQLGKLVLYGCVFGCLDPMLTIAATMSSKSPFSASLREQRQMEVAKAAFKMGDSDLLTLLRAYNAWRRVVTESRLSQAEFCKRNYLNRQTLATIEDLKEQLAVSLSDADFIQIQRFQHRSQGQTPRGRTDIRFVETPASCNHNSENYLVLRSIIVWTFYPKLLTKQGKGWRNISNNQQVAIDPTSVNKDTRHFHWLSYYSIFHSSSRYKANYTSRADDVAIVLLCGEATFHLYAGIITIDNNRIHFSVSDRRTMLVIKYLRHHLRQILNSALRKPGYAMEQTEQNWFDLWKAIFAHRFEDMRHDI